MSDKIVIIAEAGVNHNGSLETAKKLMDAARYAGADVVKFQSFVAADLVTADAGKADYQNNNMSGGEDSQFNMLKALELSFDQQKALFEYGKETGITVVSTAFDFKSIIFLASMNMSFWKIPSGEITNTPYLRKIGAFGKKVILSTGMSTLSDIEFALDILETAGTRREFITVLHCTTEYPAPFEEVNLKVMNTLSSCFGVNVGYSDHTAGIAVPIAAAALGARVIEKHFTLDRNMPGPDHAASLEPAELKEMVVSIRNVEKALGDEVKRVMVSEKGNASVARKSIVALRPIKEGELFSEDNLTVKRPGTGLSPRFWDMVIGRKAARAYMPDEEIE